MSILLNLYQKKLAENEKHLQFWTDYLGNLETLDLEQFSNKLKVPILVPIGNRILFRGELKHTNEVTVALGADYFAKCSIKQAEVLRQHRIKDTKAKVEALKSEKEFLESQMSFSSENVFDSSNKEIVEFHTEEEDKTWREDHRKKVQFYKQNQSKLENNNIEEITDDALWSRLEELELQEELENELIKNKERADSCPDTSSFIVKEEESSPIDVTLNQSVNKLNNPLVTTDKSKMILLQQVINKQNELEIKLSELKHQEHSQTNTEEDLMKRLDEIEALDELEDDLNRLEDILEDDVEETEKNEAKRSYTKIKRSVSFADEDNSKTLELTFKHSSVEPTDEPYKANVGITKPSDVYEAFRNSFKETTSILKTTKLTAAENVKYEFNNIAKSNNDQSKFDKKTSEVSNKSIMIKDVIEKDDFPHNVLEIRDTKPISLFKQRRLKKS